MESFRGYKCTYRFNAFHNISDDIKKKHIHTFWVNIYIESKTNDFTEFNVYEKEIQNYFDKFKGLYLNDLEIFKEKKPTLENMCKVFYDEIYSVFEHIDALEVVKLELSDGPLKSVSVGKIIIAGSANILINKEDFETYLNHSKKGTF